jgi:transposase InsO family protein
MSLKPPPLFVHDGGMNIIMNIKQIKTLNQVEDFLISVGSAEITASSKDQAYQWIALVLKHFRYKRLKRLDKALIQRFLMRVTGYSRQQLTRLIKRFHNTGSLQRRQRTTNGFRGIYTPEDVSLLANIDALHDTPSGPMIKKLCERAYELFGDPRYERLARISVSHLYNLRASDGYRKHRKTYTKTRPVNNAIGERRKPHPQGKPGYLRIDSVHQGDQDGIKGLYHINAVDEVTQFQVVFTVERISEQFMIPALEAMLDTFPFVVLGFHADNGSEYINKRVAEMLEKLHVELTKSRSRQTNDNALVESKNGSVIRKILGYSHIPQRFATHVNQFNEKHLVPYINYHRPCFFPVIETDDKGKERKKYPYDSMMTPYDKLKSIDNAEQYLKPGMSFLKLDAIAYRVSDNDAATQLQVARKQLFETIFGRRKRAG